MIWPTKISVGVLILSVGLPLLVVIHAVFSERELNKMRLIYLRDRASSTAARLELVPGERLRQNDFEELFDSDGALQGIKVFAGSEAGDGSGAVESIRQGRELYRVEEIDTGHGVFRAYVPFHVQGQAQVQIARIDLAENAPDFLLVHARHNMLIAVLTGSVMLVVSLLAFQSMQRGARLERERMEMERLAQLGSLAAVLAHEIRNPLGAIKGFAQLAQTKPESGKFKPLDAIVRECLRLETLVNSLLLYGRPLSPAIRRTQWETLAAEVEAQARELIGARPIAFSTDSNVAELSTDPDLLKQAMLNLVRNAVESIPAGERGTVKVCASTAGYGDVIIAVEDDGAGFEEKARSRLFAPFATTKASGTGLGLPISKKVVESLGGRLELAPRVPQGTRAEMIFHGTNTGD